jgi:S-adenosylmethionine:tRNA ribosyltransferase-isomerase
MIDLREQKHGRPMIANTTLFGEALLDFHLPATLEATEPPEARGLSRDQVRLMVSHYANDQILHTSFQDIVRFLKPGDVLVINTSGTMSAAISACRADGTPLEIHLSTRLPTDLWSVELRRPDGGTTEPFYEAEQGEILRLPGGGSVKLLTPYNISKRGPAVDHRVRLWVATLHLPMPVGDYLGQYGFPIRYKYVDERWPISYYQTAYATEMGSAEMPSAGRAFTPEIITALVAYGVRVVPLILHTGVASLEDHEPPYEEYYRVPLATAQSVNMARAAGKRVIAVGTTSDTGMVHPGEGWTSLVITPGRKMRTVDGLLTGFHEPRATHLAMLESLAGPGHLCRAYQAALGQNYLWHEFGDLHLILP